MKILDMCCGSKMFWYEKYEPHTTYMDIRKDVYTAMDRGKERKIEIAPDIQADFTDMPVSDEYRNWLNDPILGNIRSVALMIAVIYG